MATEVSAGAGVDSSGGVGDSADAGGGVGAGGLTSPNPNLAMNFVATGLTFARDSLSTVCAPDAAFGGDGVVGVIGGDLRRPAKGSSAVNESIST